MKCLYIGNFEHQHCTEVHLAGTLRDLGHTVIEAQENQLTPGELLRVATKETPDFVLWTRTWRGYVTQHDLDQLRQRQFLTVSVHLDLYVGISRQNGIADDPFWRTDHVFTADGDPESAKVFQSLGINHHWLKPGVYKRECVQGKPRDEFRGAIAFVGTTFDYHTEWPYRRELVDFLKQMYGSWFRIYGRPHRSVRGQDLNDMLASTDIIIGDSLCPGYTHENYWSDRIYETTGRGGFIIHPRIKGLETEFKDNEEVAFYNYGDFEHLKKLIDWYLEHADYREAVRKHGMNRTMQEHTYTNRMQELLEVIR